MSLMSQQTIAQLEEQECTMTILDLYAISHRLTEIINGRVKTHNAAILSVVKAGTLVRVVAGNEKITEGSIGTVLRKSKLSVTADFPNIGQVICPLERVVVAE